ALHSYLSLNRGLMSAFLSLPARYERGESRREGPSKKKFLLSPALSSLLRREEREQKLHVSVLKTSKRVQSPESSLWAGRESTNERPGIVPMNQVGFERR